MNEEHPLHMLDNQADPETKPKVILQKSIRTYEGDVAEALAKGKTSVMTMAIAESSRKTGNDTITNAEPKQYGKKILLVLISIILIVAGLGGGYYLYLKSPLAVHDAPAVNTKIPSLLISEKQKIVSLDNTSKDQMIQKIQAMYGSENILPDTMLELIFSQKVASTTARVGAQAFIDKLALDMPDTLKRSIKDSWMYGVYNAENTKIPFILLKNDYFQNAYAGMLKWESSIPDELADVLDYKTRTIQQDPLSTTSIAQFFSIKGAFEDRTIMNRDVREFRTDRGDLLVLYSFIDKDTLLITSSEAALKALIEKIEKQTYIR